MSAVLFVCWYYPIGMHVSQRQFRSLHRTRRSRLHDDLVIHAVRPDRIICHRGRDGIRAHGRHYCTAIVLFVSYLLWVCYIDSNYLSVTDPATGVLVPPGSLPSFWKFMYRVSPVTYFTAALIAGALGDTSVVCSPDEILRFPAPEPSTCGEYMRSYISSNGGYLLDPGPISQCEFCAYTDTNTILQNMGIKYSDRWGNFAITLAYSVFNVGIALLLYWLFRVPKRPKEHRHLR